MAITKSILEEVELHTGGSLYVQISGSNRKVSLSFDRADTSFNLWIYPEEAEAYANAILKAIKESRHES